MKPDSKTIRSNKQTLPDLRNFKLRNFAGLSVRAVLRRKSAAVRLLRLWGRIPPGAWMSVVSVVYFQVEIFATG